MKITEVKYEGRSIDGVGHITVTAHGMDTESIETDFQAAVYAARNTWVPGDGPNVEVVLTNKGDSASD